MASRRQSDAASESGGGASTRRGILVAGVHRSGTSALTRVLSLAGAALPRTIMPPTKGNASGYFESQPIYEAQEQLFEAMGTSWDDLAPFPPADWREQPWAEEWIDRFASLVTSEFGGSPLFVLKDPRICRLLPIWTAAFDRLGIVPAYLITLRNPLEVAGSLKREHGTRLHRALVLWLDHLISAERATRGSRRYFVPYPDLLDDWRRVLAEIERHLELALPPLSRGAEAEIDGFLNPGLRHHVRSLDELKERSVVADWVRQTWAWACEAAAGRAPSPAVLDDVAAALSDAQRVFGPLLAAERDDYLQRNRESREELARQEKARQELSDELTRVQEAREQQSVLLAERDRELSRSSAWIRNLFGWAAKTRWGESPPGLMMRELFDILKAADPGDVPQLASAGLRWIDGAREITRLEAEIAELRDSSKVELEELQARRDLEVAERDERLGELREECARLTALLENTAREGKAYATHVNDLGSRHALLEAEVVGQRAQAADLETALRARETELGDRDFVISQLTQRVATLEQSRSWRWTRPLRAVGQLGRALFSR